MQFDLLCKWSLDRKEKNSRKQNGQNSGSKMAGIFADKSKRPPLSHLRPMNLTTWKHFDTQTYKWHRVLRCPSISFGQFSSVVFCKIWLSQKWRENSNLKYLCHIMNSWIGLIGVRLIHNYWKITKKIDFHVPLRTCKIAHFYQVN